MRAQPGCLLAAAVALCCTRGREEAVPDVRPAMRVPAAPAPAAAPAAAAPAPAPAPAPAASPRDASTPAAAAGPPDPATPAPVGRGAAGPPGIEAPPIPGLAKAAHLRAPAFEGCLALAPGDEKGASRFPARAPTRSDGAEVSLKASPGRLEVSHHLRHACCLKGAVTVNREQAHVTVAEKLSGSPCRCMCSSTIRTPVVLPPGEYQVTVQTDELGRKSRPFQGTARIP